MRSWWMQGQDLVTRIPCCALNVFFADTLVLVLLKCTSLFLGSIRRRVHLQHLLLVWAVTLDSGQFPHLQNGHSLSHKVVRKITLVSTLSLVHWWYLKNSNFPSPSLAIRFAVINSQNHVSRDTSLISLLLPYNRGNIIRSREIIWCQLQRHIVCDV